MMTMMTTRTTMMMATTTMAATATVTGENDDEDNVDDDLRLYDCGEGHLCNAKVCATKAIAKQFAWPLACRSYLTFSS